MKASNILYIILILGAIGFGIGYYLFNKKVPGLENVTADFELSADQLFDAFDQDESAALAKYEGKVIAVKGKASRIKATDSTTNITLYAENAMAGGINCSFNSVVHEIKKGDNVTIKGRCQGFLMDVVLNNCTNK